MGSSSPTLPRRSPRRAGHCGGPGRSRRAGKVIAPDVRAGDTVLFGKWSGTEVTLDGEELLIMKESDIMGVLA